MGRLVRMYHGHAMWFVTARTVQRRLLLRPSADVNEMIGGIVARAARLTGVRLYAFVFMSNHVHLLAHAPDGTLSRFMQYALGNIARKVGRLQGWDGPFWHRRFAAEPVLDDVAAEGRLRYILAHGVKEGLVTSPRQWPGLSCLPQLLGAARRSFRFFHWARRTREVRASSDEEMPGLLGDRWAEEETLELLPLPAWKALSAEERRGRTERIIGGIEQEWAEQRDGAMGTGSVLTADPRTGPRAKDTRRGRPLCHTTIKELRIQFLEQLHSFVHAFREASQRYLAGEWDVTFPPLAFRPTALGP